MQHGGITNKLHYVIVGNISWSLDRILMDIISYMLHALSIAYVHTCFPQHADLLGFGSLWHNSASADNDSTVGVHYLMCITNFM